MTTLREAAQMALAVLEDINKLSLSPGGIALPGEIDTAMDMLREVLEEESKAEPVARDGWVLRDVYFHDGEPGMHRDPKLQSLPVADLLVQSKQNHERIFGPSATADWIYSDLLEFLEENL